MLAKRGTAGQAREFELCDALTTQKYDWLMLWALTIRCQHLRYVWYLGGISISLSENRKLCKWSKSKRWNCVSPALMSLLFCQQAMEIIYLSSVLFGKLFASNPNASVSGVLLSDFATQHQVDSIVEEQLREYELLSVFFLPSIWKIEQDFHFSETGHSLETFRCYRQTFHRSWMMS